MSTGPVIRPGEALRRSPAAALGLCLVLGLCLLLGLGAVPTAALAGPKEHEPHHLPRDRNARQDGPRNAAPASEAPRYDTPRYDAPRYDSPRADSLGADWRPRPDEARRGVREGRLAPLGRVIDQIRRRSPGRQLDAGLETDAYGRRVYRVRWAGADGRRSDYIVDAETGRVIGLDGR